MRASGADVVLDMVPFLDKGGHGVMHFRGVADRAVVITSCDVYRAFGRLWRSEPGQPEPVPLTEDSPLRSGPAADTGAEDVAYDNIDRILSDYKPDSELNAICRIAVGRNVKVSEDLFRVLSASQRLAEESAELRGRRAGEGG